MMDSQGIQHFEDEIKSVVSRRLGGITQDIAGLAASKANGALSRALDSERKARRAVEVECERLRRFKSLVHERLDAMGVPKCEGEDCRVAARLDCVVLKQT